MKHLPLAAVTSVALTFFPSLVSAAELAAELEALRAKHALPALAAAAVRGVKVTESAAVGMRKAGGTERVTVDDRWHVGSITKSMTATLAAMLVEQKKVAWTTTVGATFPELHDTADPQWAAVTLEQLLTQRSGLPTAPPANVWSNAWRARGTPVEQRVEFVKGVLLRRPEVPPGTKFIYSNQNYVLAGTMLERVMGEPWEKMLRESVFAATGMTQAGFGAPASLGKVDQPWGHRLDDGKLVPVPPGPQADNPVAIGPAGTVHCTIEELARYAAWHGRGHTAGTATLPREAFVKLHTAVAGGEYAMGWFVTERPWAGGQALMHNGSNTMFFAVMWVAPEKGTAFVAATNCGEAAAAKACDEAVALLIERAAK